MDLDCRECHGNIEIMDSIKYHKFETVFFINCHRIIDASVDCVTRHY
jgi:hypothetical protein